MGFEYVMTSPGALRYRGVAAYCRMLRAARAWDIARYA